VEGGPPHACAVMPWGGDSYFMLGVGGCNYDASTTNRISYISFCVINMAFYMVGSGTCYLENISGSGVIKLGPDTIILAYLTVKIYVFKNWSDSIPTFSFYMLYNVPYSIE
jgi:hypothetical protein